MHEIAALCGSFDGRAQFRPENTAPRSACPLEEAEHEIYAALASDEDGNELILNDVIRALEDHRSPILLTERNDRGGHGRRQRRGGAGHRVVHDVRGARRASLRDEGARRRRRRHQHRSARPRSDRCRLHPRPEPTGDCPRGGQEQRLFGRFAVADGHAEALLYIERLPLETRVVPNDGLHGGDVGEDLRRDVPGAV